MHRAARAAPLQNERYWDSMTSVTRDPQRIHYMDNLRAIAMLLGVYLHAALAYAETSRQVWLATDSQGSVLIDASIWAIHLFRMSLFFLLAGYFSKLLVHRRGLKLFLWNRVMRIALPFVLFYPLLLLAMVGAIVFALQYLTQPLGLMQLIAAASQNPEAAESAPPWSTMHLWFLYYLLMFSLIAAIASRWTWLTFDWLIQRPWLLFISPLALLPGALGGGVPLAAPESFIPDWWPFLFYGLFYFAGWQLFGRESLLDRWQPWCWPLCWLSAVLFVPYYRSFPVLDLAMIRADSLPLDPTSYFLECILTAYLGAMLTIAALLLGQRFLSHSNGWLKFYADSSYWVYLVHLPIVVLLQTLLIPMAWPVWVKLSFVLLTTWLFCLATYVAFVRYTVIGWMLNGKRKFS